VARSQFLKPPVPVQRVFKGTGGSRDTHGTHTGQKGESTVPRSFEFAKAKKAGGGRGTFGCQHGNMAPKPQSTPQAGAANHELTPTLRPSKLPMGRRTFPRTFLRRWRPERRLFPGSKTRKQSDFKLSDVFGLQRGHLEPGSLKLACIKAGSSK
jgi:hypothetical protein